jgi:hypothetical protein
MAAIPPAGPLANAALVLPPPVPALAAGAVPTAAQVSQETTYVRALKRARDVGGVTDAEYGSSIARHHQVVSRHAGAGGLRRGPSP